jgi:DNA topoisomerase-3
MDKTLIIAEKPSVAGDIVKVLPGKFKKEKTHFESNEYIVSYAVGHLATICEPGEMSDSFKPWNLKVLPIIPEHYHLKAIPSSKSQLTALGKLIRKKEVKTIINACDAGREGELIFRYILEFVGSKRPIKKTCKRLWLQSMTTNSIKEAFNNLRDDEEMIRLADAAKSRSEADWLIGINGSRGLTAYNSKSGGFFLTPCGRVQTPTLSLIVNREQKRLDFEAKKYWNLDADFLCGKSYYKGKYFLPKFKKSDQEPHKTADRIWTHQEALDIAADCKGEVAEVTEKAKSSLQKCPSLYDLTSLQREANSRFGFSAKMTLNIAQALYERFKVLTYPRTDSRFLPEDYIENTKKTFKKFSGTEFGKHSDEALKKSYIKPDKKIFNNSKISDHHAIIPTGTIVKDLPEAENKLYKMVVQRYIAVFYPPAEFLNTTRISKVQSHHFKTEGKVLKVAGWKVVYGKLSDGEKLLDALPLDTSTTAEKINIKEEFTKPPARYNESSLLSAMEGAGKLVEDEEMQEALKERGLGTPATRAAVIEKLIHDKYLIREGRELIPTRKAFDLLKVIYAMKIDALSSAELTGKWEQKLNLIARGEYTRQEFMDEIAEMTKSIISHIKDFDEETIKKEASFSPVDGNTFFEYLSHFESEDGKFRIRKILGGRHMNTEEIVELLTKKQIGPLEGFISKKGAPFTAAIRLTSENKVEFDFGNSDSETDEEIAEILKSESIGNSPIDDSPVFETLSGFVSKSALEKDDKGLRLSKAILGKEIGRENVIKMLSGEKTDLIQGFRSSKTKRLFDAYLTMSNKGKLAFSFPPRVPKKKKKDD